MRKKKSKLKHDPEVILTFGSARDARKFAARVMLLYPKRRVPFTKSVYRVEERTPR